MVNNQKFDIFIHLIFFSSSTSLIPILDKKLQIETFHATKKSSRLVDMFLTPERKPSFPIPKVMLDKGKDDDNNVEMDDNQSDSKMSSGD